MVLLAAQKWAVGAPAFATSLVVYQILALWSVCRWELVFWAFIL
jgi:hypothetical protein